MMLVEPNSLLSSANRWLYSKRNTLNFSFSSSSLLQSCWLITGILHDQGHNLALFMLDTGKHPLIRQPVRRTPFALCQRVDDLVQEMLNQGVIQPSQSPWASPIELVKKRDGDTRFCVDYRKLNSCTRKDLFPLPRIDNTLD